MAFPSVSKFFSRIVGHTHFVAKSGTHGPFSVSIRHLSNQDSFKYNDLSVQLSSHLKPKPDPDRLVFGRNFTDHMLEIEWSKDVGWGRPKIVPFHNLSLHPGATSLHYALQLFEGMKGYRGDDNKIRLFRPNLNMQRMNRTAHRCALPPFDGEEFTQCLAKLISIERDWVPYSNKCSLYIRPTFISTEPAIGVCKPDHALLYCIMGPVGPYFPTGTFNPVALYADTKHVRAWRGGVGFAKMGSNYGPSIMPLEEAISKGCQQTLWLYEEDHKITEVGTMNMFMYWENEYGVEELITPPLDGTILPGVTRQSLIDLAKAWGEFQVIERPFNMGDLIKALKENRVREMFGAGTACVVCPVRKILYNDVAYQIPFTETGLAARFYKELTDIQYGRTPSDWVCDIDELTATSDDEEAASV